jgi:hypothetical protein
MLAPVVVRSRAGNQPHALKLLAVGANDRVGIERQHAAVGKLEARRLVETVARHGYAAFGGSSSPPPPTAGGRSHSGFDATCLPSR